jgi:uncharacterized protein YjeT (DUF2065 family)
MKVAMYIAVIALVLIVVGIAYVRLAPTDVTRWHQAVEARVSSDLPSGAIRVIAADEAALARVDAAARDLPRTRVLAGSVEEGRIT